MYVHSNAKMNMKYAPSTMNHYAKHNKHHHIVPSNILTSTSLFNTLNTLTLKYTHTTTCVPITEMNNQP